MHMGDGYMAALGERARLTRKPADDAYSRGYVAGATDTLSAALRAHQPAMVLVTRGHVAELVRWSRATTDERISFPIDAIDALAEECGL